MLYEVLLTIDDDCSFKNPTFRKAHDLTALFALTHGGSFFGPIKVDGKEDTSAVLVDLTKEAADILIVQDYVERLPIGGAIHRGVFPYQEQEPQIEEFNFSYGGTT